MIINFVGSFHAKEVCSLRSPLLASLVIARKDAKGKGARREISHRAKEVNEVRRIQ